MFKCMDPRRAGDPSPNRRSYVTDDPLATIATTPRRPHPRFFNSTPTSSPTKEVYAVSRSVLLPRVALTVARGINPLYVEDENNLHKNGQQIAHVHRPHHIRKRIDGHNALSDEEDDGDVYDGLASPPSSGDKSSGYVSQINSHSGSSHGGEDPIYSRAMSESHDAYGRHPHRIYESQSSVPSPATNAALMLLQQNAGYVKSIKPSATRSNTKRSRKSSNLPGRGSMSSTSSASSASTTPGTLATIPEGEIDSSIPRPIWPHSSISPNSTITTSSYDENSSDDVRKCASEFCDGGASCAKDILRELSRTINEVVDGKNSDLTAEQMLRQLCLHGDEPRGHKLTQIDEDMRNLCLNLTANEKLNIVARALSGQHATSTPYSSAAANLLDILNRNHNATKEQDDSPAASSTQTSSSVVFVHKDLASVSNGVRNAVMYSTKLCRNGSSSYEAREKLIEPSNQSKNDIVHHSSGQQLNDHHETSDDKPSLWEIYYGTGIVAGDIRMKAKPTDTPSFPIGRPEADFTLDLPRAELLMRRMKADKKWRCRCRIFTSFMGLLFFLLTVMAVSLMLTRGKRMFGSML